LYISRTPASEKFRLSAYITGELTFAKKYFPKTYHEILRTPSSLKEDSPKYGDEAKAFHQRLRSRNADFLVVLAYGKIMPATTLACSHL
jgi:methionyl-tRNA formyltransferase